MAHPFRLQDDCLIDISGIGLRSILEVTVILRADRCWQQEFLPGKAKKCPVPEEEERGQWFARNRKEREK